MKKLLLSAVMLLLFSSDTSARSPIFRPLEEVFDESDVILFGWISSAGVGSCGDRYSTYSPYTLRVNRVLKGSSRSREEKICVEAPLLYGSDLVIAGKRDRRGKLHVLSDSVLLVSYDTRFYRINPSELPDVQAGDREVYAIDSLEPDVKDRFGKLLEGAGFWTESN